MKASKGKNTVSKMNSNEVKNVEQTEDSHPNEQSAYRFVILLLNEATSWIKVCITSHKYAGRLQNLGSRLL